MSTLGSEYLASSLRLLRRYKSLSDRALAQVSDEDLDRQIDREANSLSVIVRHIAGNLRSRFTDFLTTDGEKPDRHRDGEFELREGLPRDELVRLWESAWTTAFGAIQALEPGDLERTIHIRQEPLTALEAINRAVAHTAHHAGQIVLLAKHFAGPRWQTLSIPRGQSDTFSPRPS